MIEPVSATVNNVDLNLLRAFDAMAGERNVTRAAQRMGLSQSALSHSLARLRTVLDDELFVRSKGGMVLTPRAEHLAPQIRDALTKLDEVLRSPLRFDPATSRRTFCVRRIGLRGGGVASEADGAFRHAGTEH